MNYRETNLWRMQISTPGSQNLDSLNVTSTPNDKRMWHYQRCSKSIKAALIFLDNFDYTVVFFAHPHLTGKCGTRPFFRWVTLTILHIASQSRTLVIGIYLVFTFRWFVSSVISKTEVHICRCLPPDRTNQKAGKVGDKGEGEPRIEPCWSVLLIYPLSVVWSNEASSFMNPNLDPGT